MSFRKSSVLRVLAGSALCAMIATSAPVTASAGEVPVSAGEQDHQAAFLKMVSQLEKNVKAGKKQVFAGEGQVKKLKKRAETAGYRVTAARGRFDEYQAELSTTKDASKAGKLKQKLAGERRLLKADADKLTSLMQTSKELQAKAAATQEQLRPLKDDVSIEADRFESSDRGQKKAVKLIAEADWVLERLESLTAELQSDFDSPATESLRMTEVE